MIGSAATSVRAVRPAGSAHDAFFYDDEAELVSVAAAFLSEGLDHGDRALVVCGGERNRLIVEALAAYGSRLSAIGQRDVYPRAARAIAFYRRFTERGLEVDAPRIRIFGEVPFPEDRRRWPEWGRFESVCNAAFADLPLWSVCAYAAGSTPPDVAQMARLTHPTLRTARDRSANDAYVDPVAYLSGGDDGLEALRATTAPAVLTMSSLQSGEDLQRARHRLRSALGSALFLGSGVGDDFVTAATEVLINALTHGRPPVTVRLWLDAQRALCAVTDRGAGFDDPLVGYWQAGFRAVPTLPPSGLWLARQLCDDITFQRTVEGFSVRLHTTLR
jgi:anti-sigma regulatory factor (Ser/Thr protein kinase)